MTMNGQHIETEYLLFTLLAGERLAANISAKQSVFFKCHNSKISRFLKAQSRQERFHANIFRASLLWLNPKSSYSDREHPRFSLMEHKLSDAIDSGDIDESILGLQVIVEESGESALSDLDISLEKYRFGLHKIRRIVLNQEKAHHTFGERYIREQTFDPGYKHQLLQKCYSYIEDVDHVLGEVEPVLNTFNLSAHSYMQNISDSVTHCFEICEHHLCNVDKDRAAEQIEVL